ncbi:VTT domain-containing protein [Candidatus Giovannonibacteria bacterium]|nr:VTT domain-containing protein [Candidatus Giovannonibacteria bacterium]
MWKEHHYLIFLAAFVGVLLGASFFLQEYFLRAVDIVNFYASSHPLLAAFMFVALAAASVMLGPFTSAPLVPFAVALWGMDISLALLFSGWLLGNSASYAIGYYLGHPILSNIAPESKLNKWIDFLSKKADYKLLFLFRLAAPSEVSYVFGMLRYNFFKFLAIAVPAELPFAMFIIYTSGALVSNSWQIVATLSIAGLAIIAAAAYTLKQSADI